MKKGKIHPKIYVMVPDLDTGFSYILCLFLSIKLLKTGRSFICQGLMRPYFIIKAHVLIHTLLKISQRGILPAVRFFFLERCKKGFGHSVISRSARF